VFRALVAKTVDAGPAQADVFNQLEKYKIHKLEGGGFTQDLPEYTWQASFAMDRVITDNRDLLVRVLAAYGKAYRFVQSDPTSKRPSYRRAGKLWAARTSPSSRRRPLVNGSLCRTTSLCA